MYSLICIHVLFVLIDRFNDQEQEWVGLQNWIYSRQFDMSNHNTYYKSVWLKCDGIDTVANIRYRMTQNFDGGKF